MLQPVASIPFVELLVLYRSAPSRRVGEPKKYVLGIGLIQIERRMPLWAGFMDDEWNSFVYFPPSSK
jgi:hypothetical protein